MRLIFLVCAVLFALGCSTGPGTTPSSDKPQKSGPQSGADLQWSEARERAERVSNIRYDLKIDISKDIEQFLGELALSFDLKGTNQDLRIDFFEGKISVLELNGKPLGLSAKKPYWIELPASGLLAGRNEVRIVYEQVYSKAGEGLHRFKDPEDQQYYLHTQFEPYDANRFLPCFDQPDLRAELKMQVTAPKSWQVITATREASRKEQGQVAVWDFPTSAKISTYLFSLHAGPYQVFTDQYKNIPLRIFIRPALAKYLDTDEWFKITKQGLGYFEKFFATPYPFKKYDQLIVPEFNSGGMENVAAVTYYEWSVSRSKATRQQKRGIAGLLLHEMAHMWFGDLVTMAWWNDLWLNESFATLMSSLALVEATEYKEAWQDFAAGTKRGAYIQDALATTHPIEAPVTRVKEAMANFDAITYNKGASVMKQLRYHMTAEAFQKGIQHYFKLHAYKNTQLKDFIAALQAHTDKDLSLWSQRWLQQSGTDQVAAAWTCEGKNLKKITLSYTPSQGAQFRPQSFEVGLYNLRKGRLEVSKSLRADLVKEGPFEMTGSWACPDAVYPNFNDQAYVNVQLDERSLESLKTNLAKMQDPLVRALVWNDLWRMVRNSEMPLQTYIQIVENNFSNENDPIILRQVVSTIQSPRGSILSYWPVAPKSQQMAKVAFRQKMEGEFLARVKSAKSGSDDEKFWFDNLRRLAESKNILDQLVLWLDSGKVSNKFDLDIDRQWGIAHSLVRFAHPAGEKALADLRKSDTSDRGQKFVLSIESVRPVASVKEKWIQEFAVNGSKRSLKDAEEVMYGLFPEEQFALRQKYEPLFYDYLSKNKKSEEEGKVRMIVFGLLPLNCESGASTKLASQIERHQDMNPSLLKNLKQSLEEDVRCQKIRGAF